MRTLKYILLRSSCYSCKKSPQLIMMIKLSIISILLFSLASSTPLPTKEQEDQARGLLEDIIWGQIQNQINNLLGITTTRGTPILDLAGGLLGGGSLLWSWLRAG